MIRKTSILTIALLLVTSFSYLLSQPKIKADDMSKKIPSDPSILIGKLPNGLTYYIKENKKPEKRAELFLATKVGAVLEDDDQDGLAHFCEHMAFNGTKNFPKNDLVNYLESIGVKFGGDLNAFTNQEQTIYMLQVPTDKTEQFDKGVNVIRDWAGNVTYDPVEIDKERGVILEEWRLGKGAEDRVSKKHEPVIYNNSRFSERDVIGDTNVILRAPYANFTRFYKDWYRPDLMAVIAVGDFNKFEVEKMIKAKFSDLKNPGNERARTQYPMPAHKGTLVSIATDKELNAAYIQIYLKRPGTQRGTYTEYRSKMVSGLYSGMLMKRLQEMSRKKDCPFMMAYGFETEFFGKTKAFLLIGIAKSDKLKESEKALMEELNRVKQNGFTQTELDRTKKETLVAMEQSFKEKDKTESRNYAFEFMRNFNDDESIPGIAVELDMNKQWLPDITLAEVNALSNNYLQQDNNVVAISAPEKKEIVVPTKEEALAAFNDAYNQKLSAYVDEVSDSPLMDKKPKPGTIKNEKQIKELGVTEWELSNGVKVVIKPTDFKNDEIVMRAFSPGGTSLYDEKDYYNALSAASVIDESGIANMNADKLSKLLSGKIVSVRPFIGDLTEGLDGNSSPDDIETMFQLVYLYFTKARVDEEAFKAYKGNMKDMVINSKNSPESTFRDSVRYSSHNYNFRYSPSSVEKIEQLNTDKIFDLYYDRFADASDFTFFFVGNINKDKFKDYVTTYLANLPSTNRKESWKDYGGDYRKGNYSQSVKKGIEKKSSVRMIFSGDFDWNEKNVYDLEAAMFILDIKLREVLREDKGGVYGVGAWAVPQKYPKNSYSIQVGFGCNPDRVDELVNAVLDQMKDMANNLPTDSNMTKLKETLKRDFEVNQKENSFWLNSLYDSYWLKTEPTHILDENKRIAAIKPADIKKAAEKYFKTTNYMKYVLYPEK